MSDLSPKHTQIEIGGKSYGLLFNLNAIDEFQDRFDVPISQLIELMRDERKTSKVLRSLLEILINEAIDDSESGEPHVTESFIGRKITFKKIPNLINKVLEAFTDGTPESDGDDPTKSE